MIELQSPPGRTDYFMRRESQERMLAARASDCAARHAHLTMADHYSSLAREETRPVLKPAAI